MCEDRSCSALVLRSFHSITTPEPESGVLFPPRHLSAVHQQRRRDLILFCLDGRVSILPPLSSRRCRQQIFYVGIKREPRLSLLQGARSTRDSVAYLHMYVGNYLHTFEKDGNAASSPHGAPPRIPIKAEPPPPPGRSGVGDRVRRLRVSYRYSLPVVQGVQFSIIHTGCSRLVRAHQRIETTRSKNQIM